MKIGRLISGVIQPITDILNRITSLKIVGMFLLLFVISYVFINGKPFGLAQLEEVTGGVSIPDMEMSGYSPQRMYDILTAQGEAGRAFYLRIIIPQDFPFPLFYALFYATASTYLAQRLLPADHPLQHIGLLGLLAGLADWAENICLLNLLLRYPERLNVLATLASVLTVTKGVLLLLNTGILLVGLVWVLVKAVTAKAQATN